MNLIDPLPIKKAIELNKLLAPYLPEDDDLPPVTFIKRIIDNIKESGNHQIYIDAIAMMHHISVEDVLENETSDEALRMFIQGLEVNRIIALRRFCREVGL